MDVTEPEMVLGSIYCSHHPLCSSGIEFRQSTKTLYQSSPGISGSPSLPPSHSPRKKHVTPSLRNANLVPSFPSESYSDIFCHPISTKPERKRSDASPESFACAKDPEIAR